MIFAQDKYTGQSIEQILELSEEEIDLGIACLVIANEAYPNLDIEYFDNALDYMVDAIRFINRGNEKSESRIALLNYYLFIPCNWNDSTIFSFDYDDMEGRKLDNRYLNGLIATKKGCCLTLPMLYLVLADRLRWPIYPVHAPEHYFCRYIIDADSNKYYNIETTAKGIVIDDAVYCDDFKITNTGLISGTYLRTLSKKEYIGALIAENLPLYRSKDNMVDLEKSGRCLTLALACDSLNCEVHWNLGRICQLQAKHYTRLMNNELAHLTIERNSKARPSAPYNLSPQEAVVNYNKKNQGRIRNMMSTHQNTSGAQKRIGILPEPMVVQPQLNHVPTPESNQRSQDIQNEYENLAIMIQTKYSGLVKTFEDLSKWHINKAKELGMVFETTREFYLRQAEKKLEYDLKHNK